MAAAVFAAPQFLPQLRGVWRTGDLAGVSWLWAALTSVSNAAWTGYFALSAMRTALVPSISATVLAGVLAGMLGRERLRLRPAATVAGWTGLLAAAWAVGGRAGLGTALTVSFVLQVTPSVWTAYRTRRPTGISRGTWLLILGELGCWGWYGLAESDPRLAVLGCTGVAASVLMLARARRRPRAGGDDGTVAGSALSLDVTDEGADGERPVHRPGQLRWRHDRDGTDRPA
ncbi:hypothetical protein GCM10009557_58360 [Virgisporangium ochraceum]|uniref:Uncharacterized protein n=1 Tax=Virgisporangium ochraceum TaxID=65505 RepID=A0A8J4EEG2_9ACTN|nr:hypothetical protein [Virgisporangium ochraceum]GIJ71593.1 hypothetical protein Voc01_065100 [Virgisporangium ochraceum]